MVKYNWTIDDLKAKYNLLLKMQEVEKDPEKLDLIIKDINYLYEYIMEFEDPQFEDTPKLLENYYFSKEELLKRKFLWGDISLFKEETCNSVTPSPILKNASFSKKDILDLTHDFYKTELDKFFFHNFLKSFRQRYDHLIFTKEIDNKNCMGESFSILSLKEIFIRVLRNFNIEDVLTTIHEYSHATSVIISPTHVSDQNYTFCEIDSLFMEMIAADYLERIFKNGEATIAKANSHELQCCTADVIASKIDLIKAEDLFYNGCYTNNKMLKESAKKYCGLVSEEVDDIIQQGSLSYDYTISYLFAVELYNLYKNDKEKALYILRKIIYLNCKSELEYYNELKRLGLIPNMNMREYHRDINENIRKLEKKS